MLERSFGFGHAAPVTTLGGVNEGRLREIVSDHFEVLWRFLRRLGIGDADADDAVQEVVLVLARKLDQVEVGRERSFVLSTAVRVASGFRRTRRNRREVEDDGLVELASTDLDPEALAEKQRLRQILQGVLNQLPMELRAVFVLYELEELTMAEIAHTLSLPAGTVASRLRRSRELFESMAAGAVREMAS
ncbi:MAG TPA: sigma-70 family RNA polymerase sigma factor [Polyangiaceae bacterium]|nr:sigma-70 family RNA polymerase sigma factor [Polyangiaceae bacterium]